MGCPRAIIQQVAIKLFDHDGSVSMKRGRCHFRFAFTRRDLASTIFSLFALP
jgi:hypothetical protein